MIADIKASKVNLISPEERIDTTSAAGELAFLALGAIAKFERRLISLCTKDGSVSARKHGEALGDRHCSQKQSQLCKILSRPENPSHWLNSISE